MQQPPPQQQLDGVCLKFPENLGVHRELKVEQALPLLSRAIELSQRVPFQWGYIDKPQEGQTFLIYLPSNNPPNDGIRYGEPQETRWAMPCGNGREMEVHEIKFGFVPGVENMAWRVRRRFRLIRGGNPALVLVHYTRMSGNLQPVPPHLAAQQVRSYPLRPVTEPAVYVAGENSGKKVFPGAGGGMGSPMANPIGPPPMGGPPGGMPGGPGGGPPPPGVMGGMPMNPQQMIAQQNNAMEMLERNRGGPGGPGGPHAPPGGMPGGPMPGMPMGGMPPPPPGGRIEDEDSGDEIDSISSRTLALNRYRRNHELMNEVFMHAAFGDKTRPEQPSPYSVFNEAELISKSSTIQAEIDALKAASEQRKVDRQKLAEQVASLTIVH